MIVAQSGDAFTANRRCPTCRQFHLTFERQLDIGFCCGYRTPDEHYHPTVEAMRECRSGARSATLWPAGAA